MTTKKELLQKANELEAEAKKLREAAEDSGEWETGDEFCYISLDPWAQSPGGIRFQIRSPQCISPEMGSKSHYLNCFKTKGQAEHVRYLIIDLLCRVQHLYKHPELPLGDTVCASALQGSRIAKELGLDGGEG